jgi:autotransporter-associated beta strand protein
MSWAKSRRVRYGTPRRLIRKMIAILHVARCQWLFAPVFCVWLASSKVAPGATMTIDFLTGPVTQNEINSFYNYMLTFSPPPTPWGALAGTGYNAWADGETGRDLEAMARMYEALGDMRILNLDVYWADTCASERNDLMSAANGGQRVMWTGNIDKVWAPNAPTSANPGYAGGEEGDTKAHLADVALVILQNPSLWNQTVPDGDPHSYGATYFQRATNYVAKCDEGNLEYSIPLFVTDSTKLIGAPPGWPGSYHNMTAINIIMMLLQDFERLAQCHEILGDNPGLEAQYDAIVKSNSVYCVNGMANDDPYQVNGQPVYNWGYYPTAKPSEATEIHGEYDVMGVYRAYNRSMGGLSVTYGLSFPTVVPFANTLADVIYLGTNSFSVWVDGTGGTQTIQAGWMLLADWNPNVYTVLGAASITNGKAASVASIDACLLWMKNRRYQEFSVTPPVTFQSKPALVPAGSGTNIFVQIAPLGGFTNTVNLTTTVIGSPTGVSASFSPVAVSLASLNTPTTNSMLTISTTAATPPGTYTLSLVGTSGSVSHTNTVNVVVGNFYLSADSASQSILVGSNVSYTVSVVTNKAFSGSVNFGVSGLPSGAGAIFNPASLSASGSSTLTITNTATVALGNYTLTITATNGSVVFSTTVGLVISRPAANLKWDGTSSGVWDATNNYNWYNPAAGGLSQFYSGDSVLFDDTAGVATGVTLGTTVLPAVVTNNSSANNFTISGSGTISGTASLLKLGSSTLTLSTANSFSGGVTIGGGILKAGNGLALGSTSGTTFITNGRTLDINGINLGAEPVTVSGAGVGGNGAIINSGGQQTAAFKYVTLAGDTTFGGTGRWDIRGSSASLLTGGLPWKITKVGANQISLVAVNPIDSALGDIDIQQGEFAIQTSTVQLGNPTNTITVRSNATLEVWALSAGPLNKKLLLQDGATFFSESGSSSVAGPVTLSTNAAGGAGNCYFNIAGTSLTCSNVISGPGNLVKMGASPLNLTGTNTYTGSTIVSTGTVALVGAGSISSSTTITIAAGAILNASARSDSRLTLSSGQTLTGSGTIYGSLTVGGNATVSPGGSGVLGVLTITNSVILQGTTSLKLNKSGLTNDVIVGGTNILYGGTLVLTNLGGTLTNGDSFKLFAAAGYGGSFTNIMPAIPGANLAWNTNGLTNGTLKIVTAPTTPPKIGSIAFAGANLVLGGTSALGGVKYCVLASTNLMLPLANWTALATNVFDTGGNFTFTNAMNTNAPQQFYLLQVQ